VKVRKLVLRTFFSSRPESKTHTGLVKFRWPALENGRWKYLPVNGHPFYSEEQYTPGFCEGYEDFVAAVAKKIDPIDYQPMEQIVNIMGTVTRLLRDRVPIVLRGQQVCSKGGCPEGWDLWETYNTGGHDGMINLLMDRLLEIIKLHRLDLEMVEKMMKAISIDISKDRSVTFHDVYKNSSWLSTHPKDSIEARWGLKKCEMLEAQIRTVRDSIAFVETTYGKRDPKDAEFSIHLEEEALKRLNEQLTKSECHFAAQVR